MQRGKEFQSRCIFKSEYYVFDLSYEETRVCTEKQPRNIKYVFFTNFKIYSSNS